MLDKHYKPEFIKQVFPRFESPTKPRLDLELKHSLMSSDDRSSTLFVSTVESDVSVVYLAFILSLSKTQSFSFGNSTIRISSLAIVISSTFESSSSNPSKSTFV